MYKGNHNKGEIEILNEKIIFDNKYCSFYNDDVIFPQKNVGTYIRIEYKSPFSVAILPIFKDGRIGLIDVFRHAIRGWSLEIPKGFGEYEEEPVKAAQRELEEETGLCSENIQYIGCYEDSPGISSNMLHCFIANDCCIKYIPKIEKTESIKPIKIFAYDEWLNERNNRTYIDPITELLLLKWRYKDYGNK